MRAASNRDILVLREHPDSHRSLREMITAEQALAAWTAGRLAEAEDAAERLLARAPNDLLALLLLAACALRRQLPDRALTFADRAIAVAPDDHRAWNTKGLALKALGRGHEAEDALRRALALAPSDPAVLTNLANLLLARGDAAAALASFAEALAHAPELAAARDGLSRARLALLERAVAEHNRGAFEEADRLYCLVLRYCPADPEVSLFHAKALRHLGHLEAAERILADRLELAADGPALEELGRLRRAQGRWQEAIAAYSRSLACRPDHAPTWLERAAVEIAAGRFVEAIASARRAVAAAPDNLEARTTLAAALQGAGRFEAALDEIEAARPLRRRPTVDGWLAGRLSLAGQLGRLQEREQAANELHALLDDPTERDELSRRLDPILGMRLAFLLQFTACSDDRRWRFLRLLAGRIDPQPRQLPRLPPPAAGARLRIGWLSPNFGEHPTGHLLAPILEAFDRARIETFLYATVDRSGDPPPYPGRLRLAADHWRDLPDQTDAAIAAAIRADRLHLLVDLGGYLAGGRPGVLALRPAPIQLHWIMHLSGMPAPFIDATMVDRAMVPDDHPDGLHGRLIRLPHAFQPGYRQPVAPDAPSRADCGLPDHGPVLCAFNNPLKIDTATLDLWCAILRAVPAATLWLSAGPGDRPLEALRAAAAERGVDARRLVFAPRLAARPRHLARQRLAALYLDTLPFGGATSAMDALLAGLPVLTCRGEQAYGRIGTSFNTVLGLPELIAADRDAYVEKAIRLLQEPDQLAALRARVAAEVEHGPLFDAACFARALEAIFDDLVGEALARQRPL